MRYSNQIAFTKQLQSAAASGFLSRIYWIAASDDYERLEAIDLVVKTLLTPDRSLQRWTSASLDLKALSNHMQTQSLFGGDSIAVIDEAEKIVKADLVKLQKLLSFGFWIVGVKGKSPLADFFEKEGIVLDLLAEKPWEKEKRIQLQVEQKIKSHGKTIASDALSLLFDRQNMESGLLDREIDKLLCYIGNQTRIEARDIAAIIVSNRTQSLWQTAEAVVWERSGSVDDASFYSLIPAIRSQLQLGLKIASLVAENASREEWALSLPKVFPKTLEKRTGQAERLGRLYFAKGLEALFDIELKSRTGFQGCGALLELFRAKLRMYVR